MGIAGERFDVLEKEIGRLDGRDQTSEGDRARPSRTDVPNHTQATDWATGFRRDRRSALPRLAHGPARRMPVAASRPQHDAGNGLLLVIQ